MYIPFGRLAAFLLCADRFVHSETQGGCHADGNYFRGGSGGDGFFAGSGAAGGRVHIRAGIPVVLPTPGRSRKKPFGTLTERGRSGGVQTVQGQGGRCSQGAVY